jgi:hypothetical protein
MVGAGKKVIALHPLSEEVRQGGRVWPLSRNPVISNYGLRLRHGRERDVESREWE